MWNGKKSDFSIILFNKDISITVLDIPMKFYMTLIHIHSEEIVSHIFNLSPIFYFL